jgi:hypothetical protein
MGSNFVYRSNLDQEEYLRGARTIWTLTDIVQLLLNTLQFQVSNCYMESNNSNSQV